MGLRMYANFKKQPGAIQNKLNKIEKYEIKLSALRKIRWNDSETMYINNTIIFYTSCADQRQLGTSFTGYKCILSTVKEFKDIKPRISLC